MNTLPAILVVEDDDEDFETVGEVARRSGISHPLHRATNGDACMRMLQAAVQSRTALPALILLDLNTHGDDGRDVLVLIKTSAALSVIPTVVLSTSVNPQDIDFCYRSHANAYHTKPVSHTAHLKILHDIFTYWLGCAVLTAGSS